jgi:hypothetical protein
MIARWDGDTRGEGIGDGQPFMPGVSELLTAMERARWVAEDPDSHLLPHLRRACEAGDIWVIESAKLWGDIYEVHLQWKRTDGRLRDLRADIFALIGSVAESATYVHQRVADDHITYDVTTGTLDADSPFQGHGHLLRLSVRGPSIPVETK